MVRMMHKKLVLTLGIHMIIAGLGAYLSLLLWREKRSEAQRTSPSRYRYTLRGLRHVTKAYTLRSYCSNTH